MAPQWRPATASGPGWFSGGSGQLDDACLGGERSVGKRERGRRASPPFVAAVETHEARHPLRVKLTVVE